jgi:hypothetical protein
MELETNLPYHVAEALEEIKECSYEVRRGIIDQAIQLISSDDIEGRVAVAGLLVHTALAKQLCWNAHTKSISEEAHAQLNSVVAVQLQKRNQRGRSLQVTTKSIQTLMEAPWTLGTVLMRLWSIYFHSEESLKDIAAKGRLGGSALRREAIKLLLGAGVIVAAVAEPFETGKRDY